MISIFVLFGLLFTGAQKNGPNEILFAKVSGKSYEFVIDTLAFKKSVSNSLFSKESKGNYDKTEIRRSKTLGDINQDYYYVILYHYGKNLKTARYLKYDDGKLYLSSDSSFNRLYNSCVGIENKCSPNVVLNSKLEMDWICSDELGVCSIDAKECQSYKAIVLEY